MNFKENLHIYPLRIFTKIAKLVSGYLSLKTAYITSKHTHSLVVVFQTQSRGKGDIMF